MYLGPVDCQSYWDPRNASLTNRIDWSFQELVSQFLWRMNPREQQDKLAFFAACGKAVARSISVGFNQACIRALQTQKAKSARVAFRQGSRYFAVDFIMKIAHLV